MAESLTVRLSGPTVSSETDKGNTPERETSPWVGLIPISPHAAAGSLIDPPVSLPSDTGTIPAATTAPEPEDEPPQI